GYGCLCYFYAPDQHQQGLQGCQPAQVDVLLQKQEGRQRNDSEAPRAGRSVSNRRTGPLLFTYPTRGTEVDRKSTRLNSSHVKISYAVFCLKKTKNYYN